MSLILTLDSPATLLAPFGDKLRVPLKRIGVGTIEDLLRYFPTRHEDYRLRQSIGDLKVGARAIVAGRITVISNRRSFQKHMVVTEAIVEDDTGSLRLMWFRQPYIVHQFRVGDEVVVSGILRENRYGASVMAPAIEKMNKGELIHTSGLVAHYPLTRGLSQRQLRFLMSRALPLASELSDWIPSSIRQTHHLLPVAIAIAAIHAPVTTELLEQAQWRFGFEELFRFQCQAQFVRAQRVQKTAQALPYDHEWFTLALKRLSLKLTADQKKVVWTIFQDIGTSVPMNRLLVGDVGTGKTLVAALALAACAHAGGQGVLLAPTELLALQHFDRITLLLGQTLPQVLLYTRSHQKRFEDGRVTASTAADLKREMRKGNPTVIIGTHALFSDNVSIPYCSLVVVDEQHRFGVGQRREILAKADAQNSAMAAHHLSMTATPIPRTFALAFFGDFDLSVLKEFPSGKRTVVTEILEEDDRKGLERLVNVAVTRNEGVYIVCPRIVETDTSGKASVERIHKHIVELFPNLKWAVLHGRMDAEDQQSVMKDFQQGRIHGVIATTVVEVGVDVPHASLLVVMSAEHFGLAQLHQLRGRIGRKGQAAHCALMISSDALEDARERLEILVRYEDGWAIAEKDLDQRGPGVFLGVAQSGEARFRFAKLSNLELLKGAHEAAKAIMEQDPTLKTFPLVREYVLSERNLS